LDGAFNEFFLDDFNESNNPKFLTKPSKIQSNTKTTHCKIRKFPNSNQEKGKIKSIKFQFQNKNLDHLNKNKIK
jgi:hypothetical protein